VKNYRDILQHYWHYDDFRGIQQEIIESIGAGHDTLGLMPTGGGKSITFQVPALAQDGVCIVITPLIALMKDQVRQLRQKGIKAAAIYSGMQHDSIVQTLENAIFGGVKLLYVSPERLASEVFRTKIRHMQVSFICVDEAHCISQWGYDFRPSYLEIADIRKELPNIPVLALTATATPEVVDDIQDRLAFKKKNVFRMSFERKNLAYVVRQAQDKLQQLVHILKNVEGTAIVYARSRRRTKEISDYLNQQGFSATFYHAGLDNAEKDRRQLAWVQNQIRIMVATNAFGMGIDKSNVRLVIHIDCPSSLEAYFQEAGRAGRDGQKAYAVMLCNGSDKAKLQKRINDTFPEKDYLRQVYDQLAYFYQIGIGSGYQATFEFPIDKFCHIYKHFPIRVDAALKILDRAGYIEYSEEQDCQARVMFCLERDDLYRLKGNSPEEDKIIVALLRNYSGLFNDFTYIDEAFLSTQTGYTQPIVYQLLKNLSQKHIIKFVPQKRTPYIRYRQRREDSAHLIFSPAIYDNLRQKFTNRIDAMLHYVSTDNQCRSRQLLRYFGETRTHDCGQCDVCIDRKGELTQKHLLKEAEQQIMQLLNDRKEHRIKELHNLNLPYETIECALQYLIDEAIIIDNDGLLSLG
jgi:ATP-dependent DNA helicase RecQ